MQFRTTTPSALLARLGEGTDEAAWREFQDRYGGLILRFARSRGVKEAECDEVMQDVLIALSKAMPGFEYDRLKGRFRSYLMTTTLHVIYRRLCPSRGDASLIPIEEGVEDARQSEDVERAWEVEWRHYHLDLAMRVIRMEFQEHHVAAFEAYALNGEDAKPVADAFGLSVANLHKIKSRILHRVKELVRLQVAEEG